MASLANDPGGKRRILFMSADGSRQTIRLGKVPKKDAEAFKLRVERLIAAKTMQASLDGQTATWVAALDDVMVERLAAVGLVEARRSDHLGPFLDKYLKGKERELKPHRPEPDPSPVPTPEATPEPRVEEPAREESGDPFGSGVF